MRDAAVVQRETSLDVQRANKGRLSLPRNNYR
jgi:hypothetical protein